MVFSPANPFGSHDVAPTRINPLRSFLLLAAVVAVAPAAGRADTYGLPPFTEFEREWRMDDTSVKGPDVLIARTPDEWAALWKKLDPKAKDAPPVDFGRWMVIGAVTPAGKPGRAVYRIELDDASRPKERSSKAAADGALCQKPKNMTIKGARVHLTATGVSALPVRFIEDAEVDGGVFGLNEGTDQTPLRTAPAVDSPTLKGKAAYREQAERLVRESLTPEEVTRLRKGVWPGTFGERYPQPWSVIEWSAAWTGGRSSTTDGGSPWTPRRERGRRQADGGRARDESGCRRRRRLLDAGPASYVRVEVKGILVRKDDGYYVRAADAVFPATEVLVKLEWAEDKNRSLDERLQALEGKGVVAEGFLDCRRVGGDKGSLEIHVSDEKQVRAAGEERRAARPRGRPRL